MAGHLPRLCRGARIGRSAAARVRAAAPARRFRAAAQPTGASVDACPASHGLAIPVGGGGVCGLRLRAVGAIRAPACNLRPRRDRRGDGGGDRGAIRAGAGRRPHRRTRLRARRPSAPDRSVCCRDAPCGLRVARAGRAQRPGRRDFRRDVRNGERAPCAARCRSRCSAPPVTVVWSAASAGRIW